MSIQLQKLSPDKQIPCGSIISVIGKRNTGKSKIIMNLLYKLREKVDFCICMTPTTDSAEAFATCMPRQCIYDKGLDLDVIERLMDLQSDHAARGKRVFNVMLVLDDVSWNAAAFKRPAPTLARLYRNGRHLKITVACVLQDAMDYNVGLRGQCDAIFLLRETSLQMRKRLHSCWFGILSWQEFQCVLDAVTENYGALCLLNTVQKNTPSECLFWWRANPSVPPFRLVNSVFYKYAECKTVPSRERNTSRMLKGAVAVETCGDDSTVVGSSR